MLFRSGIKVDTVYQSNDTLFIDFISKSVIEFPDKKIEINAYVEKDFWDITLIIFTILGVAAAFWAAYSAYRQLKNENEESQKQIDHLAKLREIDERRLKLQVKPNLRTGGSGYSGGKNLHFTITNEGNKCVIKSMTLAEGDEVVRIRDLSRAPELGKGTSIKFDGETKQGEHPNSVDFKLILKYEDEGGFEYVSEYEWKKSRPSITTYEL